MQPEAVERLLQRNRELQSRLEEAEETLRAIREGEVDAVVVSAPGGDRVYTLKGADEAYRVMVQQMAEGALTLTPEGLILFSNEQFASMVQLPLERVIGSYIQEFAAPEDAPVLAALLAGHGGKAEMRLRTDAGEAVPAYLAAGALVLDGVECICAIVTDLTGQKRNEEIVASENLARSILEQAAGAVLVVDPGGTIIRASRAAARMAGGAVLLRQFNSVFPLRAREDAKDYPFEEILSMVRRAGEIAGLHATARMPDGRTLELLVNAALLTNPESELLGCIVILSDITDLKRAEDALRESEARERARAAELQAIMDAVPVATFVSQDPECREMFGSRVTYEMLRLPPGSNLSGSAPGGEGRTSFKAMKNGREIPPGDLPAQKAASSGRPVRDYDFDIIHEDGTRHSLLGHAVPLMSEDGRPRGAVGAFIDITDRKRTEERLRQSQKLESVGLLAGGIAHDFNNLLTGIMGNASLVVDDIGPEAADRIREVIRSAERAAALTRQLLAYSGKGQFVVRDLDVSEAVNEIGGLVEFSIPRSVQLAVHVERRLPIVRMDPGQLQQILMNLVINAGEAIGEGNTGKVTVVTSLSEIAQPFVDAAGREVEPGRYVCIEIRDTGCGIDEDKQSRIFDPFFTTKFAGRGLGLAAVAGILRSQKGAITLRSAPGSGSTFGVFLPVAGRDLQDAADEAAAQGRATVMVIDDEPSVRSFIGAALRRHGYRVVTAADGREALAAYERENRKVQAVVLDVVMPVMGANDLLPRMKALEPGLKVLLTSGYSEMEARRLCAAYPGASFIQKPYTVQQILKAVEQLLETAHTG